MRLLLSIILITIIACNLIDCMEYESQIGVRGDGYLYANTNTALAKDHIDSEGGQNYYRGYFDQEGGSVFISKYNLTNSNYERDPGYKIAANGTILISNNPTNYFGKWASVYSISSALKGNPTHFMELSSDSKISSTNWVELKGTSIITKYKAATKGKLLEKVTDKDLTGHRKSIAETIAEGDINAISGLKENGTSIYDTDAERLVKGLDSVKLPSETGKFDIQRPMTELSINGEKKDEISSGGKGSVVIGNQEVQYNIKGGVESEQEKSKWLDDLKNDINVSVYEEYKGDILSWQKDKIENAVLTVDIKSDPAKGPADSVVNYTITLRNFGQTRFDNVSVANKLPPEMTLLNQSDDSLYMNNYIYWPEVGPLEPNQHKDINFQVQIKEKIPGSITELNDSVEAEGVTSDQDVDRKSTWIKFMIQRSPMIVEMYADRDEITTGEMVTYTINIKNTGKFDLKNVMLHDSLPTGMNFVDSTSNVNLENGLVTWKKDTLSPGETKTLTYIAKVAENRADGEILNNSVAVTAQSDLDGEVKAENSSKIKFVKGQDTLSNETEINTLSNETKLVIKSANESEKAGEPVPGINLTLNTDPVSTSVMTNEEVYFDIILGPIGNETLENVYLEVELDPGLEFLSPKGLKVTNNIVSWPNIDSISGELKENFVAKVKDTNFDKTKIYITARAKSERPSLEKNKTLELKYKKVQVIEETEHSIIARQIDEGVPPRKTLIRPSRQLGEKLIWDRQLFAGWVEPRPKEIEYFIVNESQVGTTCQNPLVIGSVGEKN